MPRSCPIPPTARAGQAPALRYAADGQSWVPNAPAASAAIVATYDLPHP
jgi:hypothetical protein